MKILSVSKYKGSTCCVELDGHQNVYINCGVAAKYGLAEGINIPESALEEIIAADKKRKAREYALHLLSFRDYAYKELSDKLNKCYKDAELAESICSRLRESGLIDDRKFAAAKARELFEIKHAGIYKAKFELKRCGLDEEIIAEALEPYTDDDSVRERLEELVERKYERYLTDEKGVRKVKAALSRLGYGYDDINAVLDLYELPEE